METTDKMNAKEDFSWIEPGGQGYMLRCTCGHSYTHNRPKVMIKATEKHEAKYGHKFAGFSKTTAGIKPEYKDLVME